MKKPPAAAEKAVAIIQHKDFLPATAENDPDLSLVYWAGRYLHQEVEGIQSRNTLEAKARDLKGFIAWYSAMNGHARAEAWTPQDTQGYLSHLERKERRAPATINRAFATLRRFARWVHEQPHSPFIGGLPTRGVKELTTDEPEAKKLSGREVYQLFKAAGNLALTDTRKNARPLRNQAILALLYFTGLRVSELCALSLSQCRDNYLLRVQRKGKTRSQIYLSKECRRFLDDYLQKERPKDDPGSAAESLFLPAGEDKPLSRFEVAHILNRIADEANKHRKDGEKIKLHPHRLRHTFGSEYRERSNSDTETAAALGHAGLKYVGRYVRRTRQEREALLDEIKIGE